MQFWHKVEVHTVHAGNQCRWQEYHIHHGEYLDNLVLLDINKTEEGILEVVQTVKTKTCVIEQRIDILDNHCEAWLQFCWEEIALEEVANHTLFIHDVLTDNCDFFLKVFDLDNEAEFEQFARGASRDLKVYGSDKVVTYDPMKRIGVMISHIGASTAISLGAYAYALNEVDKKANQ